MRRFVTLFLLLAFFVGNVPLYGGKIFSPKSITSASSRSGLFKALRTKITRLTRPAHAPVTRTLSESKYQSALFNKARRAVFRALPKEGSPLSNPFTGTTFRVIHQGKPEIFGVIATHTLQDVFVSSGLLSKEFDAIIINGNIARTIPAKVVGFTPASMGDLALVKFPAKYEKFLNPLELKDVQLELPAQGYSQGYACNILTKQVFPIVGKSSVGTLISDLPKVALGDRAGLCGSPVFSTDFQWAGIHVGSSYSTTTGYIAPISILQNLVKSYYALDLHPQRITLAGTEIGRLAMNEYVSNIELLDANSQVLWKRETHAKFSLAMAESEIAKRSNVAYIRLTVGRARWMDEGSTKSYLFYDDVFGARVITTPWPSK